MGDYGGRQVKVVAESERDRGNREAVDRLRQQPETVELLDDHVDGGRSVVGARSAGDDELPAAEQKRHHVGLVDPVDEPGNCSGSYSMCSSPSPIARSR